MSVPKKPPQKAKKKPAKEKHTKLPRRPKAGQPSKKELIDLNFIEALYSFNVIDEQVSELLGITGQTLENWKKDEVFFEAIQRGKKISNDRVVKTLFERAIGYDHPEDDIRVIENKIVITPTIKHYPPETAAAKFWLKNRAKDEWRDQQEFTMEIKLEELLKKMPPELAGVIKGLLKQGEAQEK